MKRTISLMVIAVTISFCLFSCKKNIVIENTENTGEAGFGKMNSFSSYVVHNVIRKLDSVGPHTFHYELAFWVSKNNDSSVAIQLPGVLTVTGKFTTGKGSFTRNFVLKKGSYVTRLFVVLKEPVSLEGQFTTPAVYHGRPISFNGTAYEEPYQLQPISISGKDFIDAQGRLFTPWGTNYGTPDKGLMEDYWYDPEDWDTLKQDFREMKATGMNVIRFPLQYNEFMLDPVTPNQQALSRLRELIEFANVNGLYLDITGLGACRKEDQPEWYDSMTESERWATQAVFWKAIASVGKDYNNIFVYDLMNEPVVPPTDTTIWLPGDSYGGYYYVQYITQTPNGRPPKDIMRSWISQMKAAIREVDSRTPVTVGFLGLGVITQYSDLLDYNSMHIYLTHLSLNEALQLVENNQSDHPFLVEETFWYGGLDNMEDLMKTTQSQHLTAGYMGHYFGDTIEELEEMGDLGSVIMANWLKLFCFEVNPNYNKPIY